ncbi:hypothetical protein B0J18DRAFT_303204 [Chaetomium sp. MPI-SDFR-AT-0129]|nr:hypothetical protein B0J18DRAFT_303204 [Chaetomium sp. MPI-SDFR-AT-0129]
MWVLSMVLRIGKCAVTAEAFYVCAFTIPPILTHVANYEFFSSPRRRADAGPRTPCQVVRARSKLGRWVWRSPR